MSNVATKTNEARGIFTGEYGKPKEFLEDYQFPVEETEIATATGIVVPNQRAIVRTDTNTVLGTVGSNYKLLSHAEALDPILNALEDRGQKLFKRVALTKNGAHMYASVYFPGEEMGVGKAGGDSFWPGITVINSLDGILKYHLESTIYRLVCTNGMRVPTRIAGGSSVHSKNKNYTEMIEQILEFVGDKEHFGVFQSWANEVIRMDDLEKMVDVILKDKKNTFPARYRDLVLDNLRKEEQFGGASVWNLYNAFHGVLEHNLVRGKGKMDRARLLEGNLFAQFKRRFNTQN